MPSPFPGMDPFIEMQEWADFHQSLIQAIRDGLNERLPEHLAARVERRIYYNEEVLVEDPLFMVPDGVILEDPSNGPARPLRGGAAVAEVAAPLRCYLPAVSEHREAYLEIREARTRRIITLLELLSPANKTKNHRGRRIYLRKRKKVLNSRTNFVEIDLLRGGDSLLLAQPRPVCDYYALVSQAEARPEVSVYAWTLRDRLPTIGIPLRPNDADVSLNLGEILTDIYDRSRYREFLDYAAELRPPLRDEERPWYDTILGKQAQ